MDSRADKIIGRTRNMKRRMKSDGENGHSWKTSYWSSDDGIAEPNE